MRVISGLRKGLKLNSPDGLDTRPTTDRVKESVFNIIQPYLPAQRVLDLFAGSAALGIEALSRRSRFCVFVEHDKKAADLIRKNIELAGFSENSEFVFSDSYTYLKSSPAPFDVIFLDPPYNKGHIARAIEDISKYGLLEKDGIIVAETEKDGEEAERSGFETIRRAVYGKTVITVLKEGNTR